MAKFQPGQSGNPSGMRKGSINQLVAARKMIGPHFLQVCEQALAGALKGDQSAALTCVIAFCAADQATRRKRVANAPGS